MTLTRPALFSYGAFGLPLAMVALPLYVYIPQFYASKFGLSLSVIGAALLVMRLLDAGFDPLIGLVLDRIQTRHRYRKAILLATLPLAFGFIALFRPPPLDSTQVLPWFAAASMTVYAGFSLATISYQSWGAALTQALSQRARLSAAREGCGLIGVILAAILPPLYGMDALCWLFIASLFLSLLPLLAWSPRPQRRIVKTPATDLRSWLSPLQNHRFRWLLSAFMLNGIAAAIPATLFLFFARDRLQLGDQAGLFLVLYFAAAALSMPLWVALANRHGEARVWMAAMILTLLAFVWIVQLPAAAVWSFGLICILTGAALGADLVLPGALLAAVIANAGHSGQREGSYFGLWNCGSKLNLALAAGIALPLLDWLGYRPGNAGAEGLTALVLIYAVLPCLLKLMALLVLWRAPLNHI